MPPPSKTDHLPPSHPAHRQRPKSPNRVLAETEAQWIFTEAELANTPSIQDGMSQAEERETRAKGVNFIIQVGIMLKLPQLTLSTAAIFFQRFLMRASLKKARNEIPKLHHYQSAATALFLATKVEESCRKMKEMIIAFCRVAQKNPNLIVDEQSKDWWRWRDCILHNEDVLLETLCFDLTVESPHRQLFEMLKYHGIEHNKRLRNAAWAFVTDSNNTQLCLLCNSRTIAVASLYAACRYCDVALPDDAKGRPWWEGQHVRLKDVRKAVEHMCANYEQVANKINGMSASQPAATGSEGEGSIYVALSTPAVGLDGSADGWDSTRLRDDAQAASPFVMPPGSERRPSNASSIGVKRDREEEEKPLALNGESNGAMNGVKAEDRENKRPRREANDTANADSSNVPPETIPSDVNGSNDAKHEEERAKVEHGNEQSEADVKAAQPNGVAAPNGKADADEGSEEGEVEE
ncbi:hypothetical protein LTR85_012077 [Meristemomyces frigidus]|nr:hypothetical protein LTR85_012077 [Meristemomyces frigidus]